LVRDKKIKQLGRPFAWSDSCGYSPSMLTRREILIQLKDAGVKEWSLLKHHCREFELYWALRYGRKASGGRGGPGLLLFGGDSIWVEDRILEEFGPEEPFAPAGEKKCKKSSGWGDA